MCISDLLIFNIYKQYIHVYAILSEPESMLYPCRGPDNYQKCCEMNTLS